MEEIIPIERDENGRPLFPQGLIGSISHSKDFAIAATATRGTDILSVGIDIERYFNEKKLNVAKRFVLTEGEREYIECFNKKQQLGLASIIFSAKETLYKLLNPLCHCYINFHEGIFKNYDFERGEYPIELKSKKDELQRFVGTYRGHVYKIKNNIVTLSILTHLSEASSSASLSAFSYSRARK